MNNLTSLFKEVRENLSPLEKLSEQFKKLSSEELDKPIGDNLKVVLKNWPYSIVKQISSEKEAEIYEQARVEYKSVNGRDCLIKTDIDYNAKDDFGRTNFDRMKLGLAPLDKESKPYELHHIGQKREGSLVELTVPEHRGEHNYKVLHPSRQGEINRKEFEIERKEHWKHRAAEIENSINK